MIRPKNHLKNIFRIPPIYDTRMHSLRMDKNEFLPCWPEEWFKDFLKKIKPEYLSIHPELGSLYDKFSLVLKIPKENIVITAGSDLAIKAVFEVFVEPDDEVIILNPTFAMYSIYSKIFKAQLIEKHFNKDLNLNILDFLNSINSKTKLIAIANPNSPTGTIIGKENLGKIIQKASLCGAAVLIDEAYYPFYENTMIDLINQTDNLIITRTFSKAAGLAGMRIGYLISNKEIAKLLFSVKPMYEITTLSSLLAEYVLDNIERIYEYAGKVREGKDYLAEYFSKKGFDIYKGYANFLHVDFGLRRKEIVKYLISYNILFKDYFDHPSLSRFSRFTIGQIEYIKKFINLFEKICKGIGIE